MEINSCNTIVDDHTAPAAAVQGEEESGWTAYLEDFSYSNSNDTFVSNNPSLISDAAWNGSKALLRRLNFNNHRKYSDDDDDDDYKDTASSPVNSPKVSSMKQMEVNYMKSTDDHIAASGNFLGKQAMSNNFWKQEKIVEGKSMDMDKLRKRGLCLVPVSALTNYLG